MPMIFSFYNDSEFSRVPSAEVCSLNSESKAFLYDRQEELLHTDTPIKGRIKKHILRKTLDILLSVKT